MPEPSQVLFATIGTQSWTVPQGVTQISAVVIGGGGGASACPGTSGNSGAGGGGGGLSYGTFNVTPGEILTIIVGSGGTGGDTGNASGLNGGSSIIRRGVTDLLIGNGGSGGTNTTVGVLASGGTSSGTERDGGGNGGQGGSSVSNAGGGGGGGAGGYSGNGGDGGTGNSGTGTAGVGGGGGGGGGQTSAGTQNNGGGGVGVLGEGTSGLGGASDQPGTGGSGGDTGTSSGDGGIYGAGGGGKEDDTAGPGGDGAQGAVRIIWGEGRFYPSTNTEGPPPTATIIPSVSNINEGSSVTFTVNTTGFESEILNWETILSADMESDDISNTSGTVSISGSTGSIVITATSDGYTETGQTESFQVTVLSPVSGGGILTTSSAVTINDTSTGTPEPSGTDITSAFYEISNRHIDSDIYMGSSVDYTGPYDVGEVQTSFSGSGRVYIGVKITAQPNTFYNDLAIAGVQILNSAEDTIIESWIFNTLNGGSGSGWQTHTNQISGTSTPGFPVTPATASGYTYTTITTTTSAGRFTWTTSTSSTNTGAADGIGNQYKLTAAGGSNTIAPVGDAQISQTGNTYYAFRETSGSTLWSGTVMRSPLVNFSGGEKIRVIHALTGYSLEPMDPNDSLYVAVY